MTGLDEGSVLTPDETAHTRTDHPLIGMSGKPAGRPAKAGNAHRASGGRQDVRSDGVRDVSILHLPGGHWVRRRREGRGGGAGVRALPGAAQPVAASVGPRPRREDPPHGLFRIQIRTRTSAGVQYLDTVEAQSDPGYAATSVMLAETALCLALDRDQLPDRAGVLIPATAMGAALASRLRSAAHTPDTRQIIPLPAIPQRPGCLNEINKALTGTSGDQASTTATAAPDQVRRSGIPLSGR